VNVLKKVADLLVRAIDMVLVLVAILPAAVLVMGALIMLVAVLVLAPIAWLLERVEKCRSMTKTP
jgi:hypothetical protein